MTHFDVYECWLVIYSPSSSSAFFHTVSRIFTDKFCCTCNIDQFIDGFNTFTHYSTSDSTCDFFFFFFFFDMKIGIWWNHSCYQNSMIKMLKINFEINLDLILKYFLYHCLFGKIVQLGENSRPRAHLLRTSTWMYHIKGEFQHDVNISSLSSRTHNYGLCYKIYVLLKLKAPFGVHLKELAHFHLGLATVTLY